MEEFNGKTFLFRQIEKFRHLSITDMYIVSEQKILLPPEYYKFAKLSTVDPEELSFIVSPTSHCLVQEAEYFMEWDVRPLINLQVSTHADVVFTMSHLGLLGGTYFVNGEIYADNPPKALSFRYKVLPYAVNTGRRCYGIVYPTDVYDIRKDLDREFLKNYLKENE
jgi:hypothetical protein